MKILKKNITKKEAEEITDNMLEYCAYSVNKVDCNDGTYMVVGTKEEKEAYDYNHHMW
jgi:hypothetical protein